MWLDIDKIEQQVDTRQLNQENATDYDPDQDHHLKNPKLVLKKLDEFLTVHGIAPENNKEHTMHRTLRYLIKLSKQESTEMNEKEAQLLYYLKLLFPLYGLKTALNKLYKGMEVSEDDMNIVVTFVDSFSTVSLHPAVVGPIVAKIAEKVNKHQHTKTCR